MLHIGRNILSLLISRVLSAVMLVFFYLRLLNYLGPNAAGQYGQQAAYLIVFSLFVDLGMQQLVIKKVSENKQDAGKYLSNYFGIQFLLGLTFMLIMDAIVLSVHYPTLVRESLLVTAFGLLLSSMTYPFLAIINAYERFSFIAKVNFLNSIINVSMMILAVQLRMSIFFLSFTTVIVSAFNVLVFGYFVNWKLTKFVYKFDKEFWKKLFVLNLPFVLLTIFSVYNRIDSLLLPHLRGYQESGYYSAAYKIWDILAFIPASLSAVLYPYFAAKLFRAELADVKKVLETYTRFMIALAVPLIVGSFILADRLITLLDPDFAPAATALWILVSAVSVLMIYVPVNSVIISQRTKTATAITGFTLLFNVAANLVFVPKFGFVAAAVITFFSELLQLFGYTFIVQSKIVRFDYFINFIKPIVAGLAMAAIIYFLRNINLAALIVVGAGIYAAALLALGFFRKDDWELLKTSVNFRKNVQTDVPVIPNV